AGAARVLWASDAHDTKLCRYPVQHLADALADRMQCPATASADPVLDIEHDVFARQMIGQRLAPRWRIRVVRNDRWTALPDVADIAVDILQTERQLVGVDALGTAPELHSLKLFDDRLEALDLAVFVPNRRGDIAHQALQKHCICREIIEIELH